MKQLLLIATILVANLINAQEGSPVAYTDVVKVSDSTKSAKELYSNAKMWFTKTFKNPKNVIVLDDPENNIIVGRGTVHYIGKWAGGGARTGNISFKVSITSKQGRYKYEINEFISDKFGYVTDGDFLPGVNNWIDGSENFRKKIAKDVQGFIEKEADYIIHSLTTEMNTKSIKNDDW